MAILCCLAWFLLAIPIIVAYLICLLVVGLFLGPNRAQAHCQPILDKLTALAKCCSGK